MRQYVVVETMRFACNAWLPLKYGKEWTNLKIKNVKNENEENSYYSMLHVGLGRSLMGLDKRGMVANRPQEWPRVENMTPAEASPADDTEALEQAKEALEKLMSEAEVNKDRDGALKEAYENAAQKWLMI